jgi:hypothetical protein
MKSGYFRKDDARTSFRDGCPFPRPHDALLTRSHGFDSRRNFVPSTGDFSVDIFMVFALESAKLIESLSTYRKGESNTLVRKAMFRNSLSAGEASGRLVSRKFATGDLLKFQLSFAKTQSVYE